MDQNKNYLTKKFQVDFYHELLFTFRIRTSQLADGLVTSNLYFIQILINW